MRFSSLRSETTAITRALSCVVAAGFALALAGPASAAGGAKSGGSMEPAPSAASDDTAANSGVQSRSATAASIYPLGDIDTYNVELPGGAGTVYTFTLYNLTRGFDAAMVIRGAGRTFAVNRAGPGRNEVYKVLVKGTVRAKVSVGAFHGASVGNYVLRITP